MKHFKIIAAILLTSGQLYSQHADTVNMASQNIADQLLSSDSKLTLGGYGEVHYNQPINSDTKDNGALDVHRMVLLLGYNFSKKTQFITKTSGTEECQTGTHVEKPESCSY